LLRAVGLFHVRTVFVDRPFAMKLLIQCWLLGLALLHGSVGASELASRLKAGQHVLLMRHAYAPGVGDPRGYSLDRCDSQRRLNDEGRRQETTEAFVEAARTLHPLVSACMGPIPEAVDVVITLTTSQAAVYDEAPRPGRIVVGVGAFKPEMAEIGANTLNGSDLYADDPVGAQHEAGDLLAAGVDWSRIQALGRLLGQPHDHSRPAVFKSVGTAAWDLAVARVALARLKGQAPQA